MQNHCFFVWISVRQGVRKRFGAIGQGVASGLSVRHDQGNQYMAHDFRAEIAWLGAASSPAFIRAPEGNGTAERFFGTLKENLLWVRTFHTVADPMQLPQVVQGTHPGEAGLSALEYLLAGHDTVPPERGIFLPRTRRMHPDLCRFVSEQVYEGRLSSDESAARQALIGLEGLPASRPRRLTTLKACRALRISALHQQGYGMTVRPALGAETLRLTDIKTCIDPPREFSSSLGSSPTHEGGGR